MRAGIVLVAAALLGCGKPSPAPVPPPVVATPRPADAATDPLAPLIADTLAYTDKLMPIMLAFDGNCDAHADRLLVLEPLVTSIRARGEALDDAQRQEMRQRMMAMKDEVLAKVDAQLAALHASRDAVEAKDRAIKAACSDNARVKDAMDRVGVFKKKKS